MHLLCCICIVQILFLCPGGLSPVCVCFGTLGVVTRCFCLFLEGRCFEEGVERLVNDVILLLFFYLCLTISCVFLLLSLFPQLYFCVISPLSIFLQYQCQLRQPRLTSLQTEEPHIKEEEREKGGYLSRWSSQKTALPTWTDCFSRSTAGTQTDTTVCMHHTHTHILMHVQRLLSWVSGLNLCCSHLHYAWLQIFFVQNHSFHSVCNDNKVSTLNPFMQCLLISK